jgi:hypothetical protein
MNDDIAVHTTAAAAVKGLTEHAARRHAGATDAAAAGAFVGPI